MLHDDDDEYYIINFPRMSKFKFLIQLFCNPRPGDEYKKFLNVLTYLRVMISISYRFHINDVLRAATAAAAACLGLQV